MTKGAEDPGQITATEHSKRDIREQIEEMRQAKQKAPCGCSECQECGECRADVTKARLVRQNSLISRLDSRVLALLEKAIAS